MSKMKCYTCTLEITKRIYRVHTGAPVVYVFCSGECYDICQEWSKSTKLFTLFEAYLLSKYGHLK